MRYLSVTGKTWNIPKNAEKPGRTNKRKRGTDYADGYSGPPCEI